jgi:hypothetical protein
MKSRRSSGSVLKSPSQHLVTIEMPC